MDHIKQLQALIRDASRRTTSWQTFSDFLAMSAISLSNAVDYRHREAREGEYLGIAKRYERDELELFPQMLNTLVEALEDEPRDVLGRVFHELDLGNEWKGQFFTPDSLCRLIAAVSFGGSEKEIIRKRGFLRASEPAVGAGAMVIALAREMLGQGVNYQQHLHVTAADIDIRAVHMAYVQLSLLHVPAIIVHGNSLSLEEWSHWHTPAHIMGGWTWKLKQRGSEEHEIIAAPALPEREAISAAEQPEQPLQLKLF
jgi:hypothetical protein